MNPKDLDTLIQQWYRDTNQINEGINAAFKAAQDFAYLLGLSRGRTETKRAVEAERARIIALLNGIDKDEISHPDGWWETSTGADFGASILQKIRNGNQALTTSPLDESTQDFDALASGKMMLCATKSTNTNAL